MWIMDSMVCLRHGHIFTNVTFAGSSYEYCLRCGKVKVLDVTLRSYASLPSQAIGSSGKSEDRILANR